MELIGTVGRLQVQRSRLKPGPRGARVYDPAPLLEVEALEVGPRGCVGLRAGERVIDVHHADHPDSRNRDLVNGVSLLPRTHYARLQERYGDHLQVGVAGESLLVDLVGPWPEGSDLLLETSAGRLRLTGVLAAPPCVEFSRFCLRLPVEEVGEDVRQALVDLDGGLRGYYAGVHGHGTVLVGARLWTA
ncbi:MAG: hypothetical protein WCD35_02005 [Mycobacteriales bacterium]